MVGIAAFTVPSPDVGPAVLAAPLWALALLHYWRAVGEGQRGAWFLLALDLGLLLLANYVGLILFALLIVFTLATARGRRELLNPEPWIAGVLLAIVMFPHAAWLASARDLVLAGFNDSAAVAGRLAPGARPFVALGAAPPGPTAGARETPRPPAEPFAKSFVSVFPLALALGAIAVAFASGRLGPLE